MTASPNFVLWKWKQDGYRTVFNASHVNNMVEQLKFNGIPPEKVVCITDDPAGVTACRTFPLWGDLNRVKNVSGPHLPSCYRRLKLFDGATLEQLQITKGERVVSFDLDAVICRPIERQGNTPAGGGTWDWEKPSFLDLFNRSEKFVGWYVPGTRHRTVMNGSMWMFTAGEMQSLWDGFNPLRSPLMAVSAGYMGSDQGYLSHQLMGTNKMRDLGGWTAQQHGVLSYVRDVRQTRVLPKTARVVFFAGKNKPWDPLTLRESPWIRRYTEFQMPPARQAAVA